MGDMSMLEMQGYLIDGVQPELPDLDPEQIQSHTELEGMDLTTEELQRVAERNEIRFENDNGFNLDSPKDAWILTQETVSRWGYDCLVLFGGFIFGAATTALGAGLAFHKKPVGGSV